MINTHSHDYYLFHPTAIRSGDFYMFEEDSETEEEDVAGTPEELGDSEEEKNKKLGPLQVRD